MCVAPSLHNPTAVLPFCLPGFKATATQHASCGCWGCQKLYNDVHDHSRLQNAKHCRRLRPTARDSSHRACSEAFLGQVTVLLPLIVASRDCNLVGS